MLTVVVLPADESRSRNMRTAMRPRPGWVNKLRSWCQRQDSLLHPAWEPHGWYTVNGQPCCIRCGLVLVVSARRLDEVSACAHCREAVEAALIEVCP